jgi:hypothetical protein
MFTKEEQQDFSFLPRSVVESRWDRATSKASYVAEVSFYGQHYILSKPLNSREDAKELGNKKAAEMKAAMLSAGMCLVKGLSVAKE